MRNPHLLPLANAIVQLRTKVAIREGGYLSEAGAKDLWNEAMGRTEAELKQWVELCEKQLANTPHRQGARQLQLDIELDIPGI
jgi:hypothetical protein